MKPPVSLVILSALLLGPVASRTAWAGDPSVDQIIASLKPADQNAASRGLRAMAPSEPETPARARHRVHAAGTGALDLSVDFRTGSAELTPAAQSTIDRLGAALADPKLASYRFRIEGHTDTVGEDDENLKLSQARAETVAGYLEKTYGVAADRLVSLGMGKQGLLVPTPDQTNEARNRRVHVVNVGKA